MPKITPEIKDALVRLADDMGSAIEISRKTGISHSTFSKYFSGQITRINQANWNLIAPLIFPYLPEKEREIAKSQMTGQEIAFDKINPQKDHTPPSVMNTIRNTPELRECIKDAMLNQGIKNASELCRLVGYDCPHTLERLLSGKINWFPDMLSAVLDNLKISHDDAPMTPTERGILQPEGFYFNDGTQKTRAVLVHYQPVISWANAATYVNSMLSKDGAVMEKWNPDEVEETVPVPLDIRGTCCIFHVAGQSMEPAINDGDILYCEQVLDLKTIPDKRVVVVLFADCSKFEDCIVCKRFRKIGEKILLASDNPIGREFEVEPKDISWIGILRKLTKNGDSI